MGNDLETTIKQLGSYLGAVHLSDNDGRSDLHLLPGEGINLSAGLNGYLANQKFSGPIVYEINPYKYSLKEIINYILMTKV